MNSKKKPRGRITELLADDTERPDQGPAKPSTEKQAEFRRQVREIAPETHPHMQTWKPGDAPSQAQEWCVEALAKAGTLSIIGGYPPTVNFFPLGTAMGKT